MELLLKSIFIITSLAACVSPKKKEPESISAHTPMQTERAPTQTEAQYSVADINNVKDSLFTQFIITKLSSDSKKFSEILTAVDNEQSRLRPHQVYLNGQKIELILNKKSYSTAEYNHIVKQLIELRCALANVFLTKRTGPEERAIFFNGKRVNPAQVYSEFENNNEQALEKYQNKLVFQVNFLDGIVLNLTEENLGDVDRKYFTGYMNIVKRSESLPRFLPDFNKKNYPLTGLNYELKDFEGIYFRTKSFGANRFVVDHFLKRDRVIFEATLKVIISEAYEFSSSANHVSGGLLESIVINTGLTYNRNSKIDVVTDRELSLSRHLFGN